MTGEGGAWPIHSVCYLPAAPPTPSPGNPGLDSISDPSAGAGSPAWAEIVDAWLPGELATKPSARADPERPRENHHQGSREDAQKHQEVGDQERKETDNSAPGDANH